MASANRQGKTEKKLSAAEARVRIQRYCAYQERSHKEVRSRLFDYGLYSSEIDELISQLITDGFLNEERFAKAYAGGKFRIMKWGRVKIQHELEHRGLTKNCIRRGLDEIDSADYRRTLKSLITSRAKMVAETDPFKRKGKIARYVISKGYEPDLVWDVINDLLG